MNFYRWSLDVAELCKHGAKQLMEEATYILGNFTIVSYHPSFSTD
jgi:hypothetical protein